MKAVIAVSLVTLIYQGVNLMTALAPPPAPPKPAEHQGAARRTPPQQAIAKKSEPRHLLMNSEQTLPEQGKEETSPTAAKTHYGTVRCDELDGVVDSPGYRVDFKSLGAPPKRGQPKPLGHVTARSQTLKTNEDIVFTIVPEPGTEREVRVNWAFQDKGTAEDVMRRRGQEPSTLVLTRKPPAQGWKPGPLHVEVGLGPLVWALVDLQVVAPPKPGLQASASSPVTTRRPSPTQSSQAPPSATPPSQGPAVSNDPHGGVEVFEVDEVPDEVKHWRQIDPLRNAQGAPSGGFVYTPSSSQGRHDELTLFVSPKDGKPGDEIKVVWTYEDKSSVVDTLRQESETPSAFKLTRTPPAKGWDSGMFQIAITPTGGSTTYMRIQTYGN